MNSLHASFLPAALLALVLGGTLVAAGCAERSAGAGDPHADRHLAQAGDDHGGENEQYTHYTPETELFLEAPALVAGETATFTAHVTRLADFKPVRAGRIEVVLSGGNLPEERFSTDTPQQPGIFTPQGTPRQAGERRLTVVVDTAKAALRHELGMVRVFANKAEAAAEHHEHEHHHDHADVVFTKEQQWKVDFAVAEAVVGSAHGAISGTGVLRAHPDAEAQLTAPAPGQVIASGRFPHVGTAVKRGQILAHLAPRLGGETDYAALEADAAKARVAHAQARRELQRMEALFTAEAVPEKRLQAARADEQTAAAELAAASRRLGQYGGGERSGIPIRAPIDGVVAEVNTAPGAYAHEGALLFHIADTRRIWLEVRVPEAEAARLGSPTGVWFSPGGDGAAREYVVGDGARLIAVGQVIEPTTRTVPVIFELTHADPGLRLGQAVQARVRTAALGGDTVLVPAAALQDENGTATLYVQSGGESFQRRIVRPGVRDGNMVEIRDGIAAGERVVTQGAYLVRLAATKTETAGHAHAH